MGAAFWAASPVAAQQSGGIAVVDQERLFRDSRFGQELLTEIDQRGTALAAENSRIQEELTAEERALTDARGTLDLAEFRARAEAFDQKVRQIRAEQDAKSTALTRMQDQARQEFVRRITPILGDLLAETGADVLLDVRVVLATAPRADLTDRAIARIDAEIAAASDIETAPDATSPEGPQ